MVIRSLFFLQILGFQSLAVAASGAVPTWTVLSQIINFSILVGGLYFFQRKSIAKFFADKREGYLKHVNSAAEAKKAAELKLAEITERVNNIEDSFKEQIKDARKNAEHSYRHQISEAQREAERVKQTANLSLEIEMLKEIESLRIETFQKSASLAESNLEKNISPEQLKAWNSHFVAGKEGVH